MVKYYYILLLLPAFLLQTVNTHGQYRHKAQLDSLLNGEKRDQLPGFAVRILSGNEVVYQYECGYANVRKKIPFSQQTVSNIGSVTKQFTAYCIYLLEDKGMLKTSDTIQMYLPEVPNFGHTITLKHLMAHTSGLRDYPDMMSLISRSTNNRLRYEAMIDFLHKHRELNFAPGEQFCYSNTGYMMLAKVIERVSGKSYATFLKDEVFIPLGMKTAFVNEGVLNPTGDQAEDYTVNEFRTKARKANDYRDALGATGIFCSLEDLSKWNSVFVNHQALTQLSSVITRMEQPFTLNDGSNCHYGGGLILKNYRGMRVIEHSGGWGEYLTQYRRFPTQHLTILIFTNSLLDSPFDICDRISNLLLPFHDKTLPEPAFTDGFDLTEMNGTYMSSDNIVRHIRADEQHHCLTIYNLTKTVASRYTLQQVESLADQSMGLFFKDSAGNELVFHRLPDSTKQFVWYAGTYFQTKRIYTEIPTYQFTDAQYAGGYSSLEMNRSVRIRYIKKQQKLVIVLFRLIRYPLEPIGQHVYRVDIDDDPYFLRFDQEGFLFGNDWVFHLRVKKKQ